MKLHTYNLAQPPFDTNQDTVFIKYTIGVTSTDKAFLLIHEYGPRKK